MRQAGLLEAGASGGVVLGWGVRLMTHRMLLSISEKARMGIINTTIELAFCLPASDINRFFLSNLWLKFRAATRCYPLKVE